MAGKHYNMNELTIATLLIAEQEIGVREDPKRPNRGKRVEEYLRFVGLDPDKGGAKGYPWCAAFVCWCVGQALLETGMRPSLRYSGRVFRLLELNPGLVLPGPIVGSIFIHLNPDQTGHTGFITGLREGDFVDTLEGNTDGAGSRTGGQVMRQVRPYSYVKNYLKIVPHVSLVA